MTIGTYLTFEFNRIRHIDNKFLKEEIAQNHNTPVEYLRELYYDDKYDVKSYIMENSACPEDLFKDYYTIKYDNQSKSFIRNIHIPQHYIQFIINKFLDNTLPGINSNYKPYCMTLWSIHNLIDCKNITNRQLVEIYKFMENEYILKHERDYKDHLNAVKRKIKDFDSIIGRI
jgi:hypothetical protein